MGECDVDLIGDIGKSVLLCNTLLSIDADDEDGDFAGEGPSVGV